jgi:hypothetical protein
VVATPPKASVTANRELTSREQNLFGEKYSSATLKALGLTKNAPTHKAAKGRSQAAKGHRKAAKGKHK